MFAEVTDKNSATFGLSGTADVTVKTPIGDVPIAGILFDVSSTLQGESVVVLQPTTILSHSIQVSILLEAQPPPAM